MATFVARQVLVRILVESLLAASRAEVVRLTAEVSLLGCGRWVNAHPADGISNQQRTSLWSTGVCPQHFDSARRDEAPSKHCHQQQKRDIQKRRVVPGRLGFEEGDLVIGRSQAEELERASDEEAGQRHGSVRDREQVD